VGERDDEIARSPAQRRAAIAEARAELVAHLCDLVEPPFPDGGERPGDVAMQSKPKRGAAKRAKAESEAKKDAKPSAPKKKRSTTARMAKDAAQTAGHVLDTMAAGAVVGAVKAAAQAVEEKQGQKKKGKTSTSTGEVLGGMAPDAAMGAIAGAAQAVMPQAAVDADNEPKPKKVKAKGTKGGAARKK